MSLDSMYYAFEKRLKRRTLTAIPAICLFSISISSCLKSSDLSSGLIVVDDEHPAEVLQTEPASHGSGTKPVTIELFAMSKCPFFPKAFFELRPVVENLGNYADFKIHYVGEMDRSGGIESMHGPEEVEGDLQQLCAQNLGTRKQWLDFLTCQLEDAENIPANWRACAKDNGIDALPMESCYRSEVGRRLLAASIAASRKNDIKATPTIMLNGKEHVKPLREISIGRAICGELEGKDVEACSKYPPAEQVSATIVTDKRCTEPDCDRSYSEMFLNSTFDSVKISNIDYSDPGAAELFKKSKMRFVPIAVFGPSIRKDEYAYRRLSDFLVEMENGDLAYPIGRSFDPTVEICDDGTDNTDDGKIDCEDPFCKSHWLCRPEKKNSIMLFVMSHCPYCTVALESMNKVISSFGRDRKLIDFSIGFVGEISADELYSAHGGEEVAEDLRQICAQKLYFKNYKFMEYVLCRNKAFMENRGSEPDEAWKSCAINGIDASVISGCAEEKEGKKLLADSFNLAKDLEIGGTPTWLLNNKYEMDARSAKEIIDEFCHRNTANPFCGSH